MIKKQQGIYLLEVCVVLAIVSGALISLCTLLQKAVMRVEQSYDEAMVVTEAASLRARLQLAQKTGETAKEWQRWHQAAKQLLPGVEGSWHCDQGICAVEVRWKNRGTQHVVRL